MSSSMFVTDCIGIMGWTGILEILIMVSATMGAHMMAMAPSRSARTDARMASSTVDAMYSLTLTVPEPRVSKVVGSPCMKVGAAMTYTKDSSLRA